MEARMVLGSICTFLDGINWAVSNERTIYGGLLGFEYSFWYDVIHFAGEQSRFYNVLERFCGAFSGTITPMCQAAIDKAFGFGMTILNSSQACSDAFRKPKSAATQGLVIGIIGGCFVTLVGGAIIARKIYNCRKPNAYQQID
jgi:hypothetical protein